MAETLSLSEPGPAGAALLRLRAADRPDAAAATRANPNGRRKMLFAMLGSAVSAPT